MSPHVMIGESIDDLQHSARVKGDDLLVQRLISNALTTHAITVEEFNYYCSRLNQVAGHKEAK